MLPLLLLLPAAAGCGIEESYTGMGDQAQLGDPLRPRPAECTCECSGGGGGGTLTVDDLSGMAWRFSKLELSKPTTMLNTLYFAGAIGGNPPTLNVLLAVDHDDRQAGTLAAKVGAGDPQDDGYALKEPTAIDLLLSGATFATKTEAVLVFPISMLDPPALAIRQLALAGTFTTDAAEIRQGVLRGVLLIEDAQQVKLAGGDTTFDELLTPLQAPDHYGADGQPDGWNVQGSYAALQVEVVP